ncbi:MAG: hypothetical protein K6253_00770 [Candidatus Liberibacter asiaticus]|nr:hypothetical protein [Candidatus Liberibacter asiaticus]
MDKFPPSFTVPVSLQSSLRYGENPHQKAAFYVDKSLAEFNGGGIATAIQHHGKVSVDCNYALSSTYPHTLTIRCQM